MAPINTPRAWRRRTVAEMLADPRPISGGDGSDDNPAPKDDQPKVPLKLQDLKDEAARCLTELDDIIKTAKEANRTVLEPDERTRHDELVTRHAELEKQIAEAQLQDADAQRFADHETRRSRAVPVPGTRQAPPSANRNLDELLWATRDEVEAGHYTESGTFEKNAFGARNQVEQVTIRTKHGGSGAIAPRISEFLPDHQPAVRNFQKTVSDMAIFGMLIDPDAKRSTQGFQVAREHPLFKERYEHVLRALDVDTAGEGGNWVPTGIGAEMHEKVRAAGKVATLFPRIDMPTNPWKWPLEGADATAYRVGEPTSDTETKVTASTPGTQAATFDAEIFGARSLVSRSLEPDSALAILPFMKNKLVRAFVDAEEKAIIDGDSDGTHQDSDVSGTADARTAWDGLRKRGLANTSHDGGSAVVSLALYRAARAKMVKWGLNPADLAVICSIGVYFDFMNITEVTTVDKYGVHATVLNGELAKIDGSPLIVSEHFREDLNASGVHDGVTETQTGLVIVNKNEWALGQRMALDVETDDSIYRETFQRVMVGFTREDFQNIGESAGDDTAYLYNLD